MGESVCVCGSRLSAGDCDVNDGVPSFIPHLLFLTIKYLFTVIFFVTSDYLGLGQGKVTGVCLLAIPS